MSSRYLFDDQRRELYLNFEKYLLDNGFIEVGEGGYRRVFGRKNIVIKIPYNVYGIDDNLTEADIYKKFKNSPTNNGWFVAACRLIKNNCLMMRRVEQLSPRSELFPEWGISVDCWQVGKTKDGKIVAYDYAFNY